MAKIKKSTKKKTPRKKFRVNDIVRIRKYPKESPDSHGRVTQIEKFKGRYYMYHVSNGNMPFLGTVCDWFEANQLRLDPPNQHKKKKRCPGCGRRLKEEN